MQQLSLCLEQFTDKLHNKPYCTNNRYCIIFLRAYYTLSGQRKCFDPTLERDPQRRLGNSARWPDQVAPLHLV